MKELRRLWDSLVLPPILELACGQPGVSEMRRSLVPQAQGRVLEVGVGPGLNLPFYDPEQVEAIVAVDPSAVLLERAAPRAAKLPLEVALRRGKAESLSEEDESFDTVVLTYTLCSVQNGALALRELARVLRPGGQLLVVEHGLSPDLGVARWQRRLEPAWSALGGGCRLGVPVSTMLEDAGFDVSQLEQGYRPGPRWASYSYWGQLSLLGK